ncbi:glycosyl transferase group 1 [Catenulispora acidiphila DSM 44928]|uniref:Glycosyl transferase group 1 n=1 Tax=Catenulispora acidiphila (strain DSM 44928 / JCM 14897 / NBRC 102108 / NRRL B-24433 / ID139908) TaxID=479433 RepID=C7Q9T5_CATAD|nr:glycosyltransferase [Catenulispora acidiphila]ACU76254.1 glycosyl transferase group 1 [Catenulispora acidiphila DSM 44928]
MTSFGFLSTYPPTQCGLATFSAALVRHLTGQGTGDRAGVVRVVDAAQPAVYPDVVAQLVNGSPTGAARAAAVLNRFDVAVVQHEFGIYGGRDGEDVLRLVGELTVPAIVVLHTVLAAPTAHQRQVLERIADAAAAVVVMSRTAADRLREGYLVDTAKVSVIPHGALSSRRMSPPASFNPFAPPAPASAPRRPTVLTWGLLGPGKGIERAIAAFAGLGDLTPAPRYVIAGQTHPKVLARDGEAYRDSLRAQAEDLGIAADVEFDTEYRNPDVLMDLVRSADVVLLPYDSTEQVTSGVLIEAVAAGRPIVATRFPHAVELLEDGAGLLVAHEDVPAMTEALRAVLTQPALAASMTLASGRIAPDLAWTSVAESYRALAKSLLDAPITAAV